MYVVHPSADKIRAMADKICENVHQPVVLTDDDKRAILWASILLDGKNVRWKVEPV